MGAATTPLLVRVAAFELLVSTSLVAQRVLTSVLTYLSTTLCLLHRAHMPPAGSLESRASNGYPEETAYPSRTIAYQAAGLITSIIEALQTHDQLRYTPAFM